MFSYASGVIYFLELFKVRTLFLCKHIIYLYALSWRECIIFTILFICFEISWENNP
jgi:hypothetical protein